MNKLTFLILGLISISASIPSWASTAGYDLQMQLSVDGKRVSSPRVIVQAGESASLTETLNGQTNYIEVVATETHSNAIRVSFVVGVISPNGQKIVTSTPVVITRESETATFTQAQPDGKSTLALSVIPVRKILK